MYSLTVTKTAKVYFQAENCEKLVVNFTLSPTEEGSKLETYERSLAFPLDSKTEIVQNELKKYLETFNRERELAVENKKSDEAAATADKTMNDLKEFKV